MAPGPGVGPAPGTEPSEEPAPEPGTQPDPDSKSGNEPNADIQPKAGFDHNADSNIDDNLEDTSENKAESASDPNSSHVARPGKQTDSADNHSVPVQSTTHPLPRTGASGRFAVTVAFTRILFIFGIIAIRISAHWRRS